MAFEFGITNRSVKLKDQGLILSSIHQHSVIRGKGKHVLFLTEYALPALALKSLCLWIDKSLPDFDYDVVTSSVIRTDEETIKKQGIFRFYRKNKTDFQKYIREDQTIVVTLGFSISAITLSSDINTECFYDYVFNKTYFYAPQTGTYVFPIDSHTILFKEDAGAWIPQDHSRMQFALMQLGKIRKGYKDYYSPPLVSRAKVVRIRDRQGFIELCDKYEGPEFPIVAWDTETTGLDSYQDKLGCITLSFDGITGYYVPWEFVDKERLDHFLKNKFQVTQNGKFDAKFLRRNGVPNARVDWDTLHAGNLINEMRSNGLKSLAYYYTSYGGYDLALDEFIDRYSPDNYMDIPENILSQYAAMDAVVTFLCYEAMLAQIGWIDATFPPHGDQQTMSHLLNTIVLPAVNDFIDVELEGVAVDPERWDQHADMVEKEIAAIKLKLRQELEIEEIDEVTFSLNAYSSVFDDDDLEDEGGKKDSLQSTMKLGKVLEAKGWEDLGRAKAGHYLTGDDQLQRWEQLGHKEAKTLGELRSWLVLQKTFIGRKSDHSIGWRRYARKHPDGTTRIHPSYKVMMTGTLRNGCGDPNYQQIPSHSLGAEHFKKIFSTPDPKKYFLVSMDYASFQMRLATIDSEDPVLMKEYLNNPNVDMHSKTAYNVFCKDSMFDLEEIEVAVNGKIRIYFPHEEVEVIRDGHSLKVHAKDLQETDLIKESA